MKMKKIFMLILTAALIIGLAACGDKPQGDTSVKVSFDSDGGSAVSSMEIKKGSTVTQPEKPTKDGFIFGGWTLNGSPFDFSAPVTEDITLKASWKEDEEAKKKAQEEAEKKAKEEAERKEKEEAEKRAKDVKSMKFKYRSAWVLIKNDIDLELTTDPAESRAYAVYTSSDEKVATVNSDGVVYGLEPGVAEITAKIGEKSVTIPVEVVVKNTGIYTPNDIYYGNNQASKNVISLDAAPLPEHAMNKTLSYSSSDTSVATVDKNGNVTGHALGYAQITISDECGHSKTVDFYNNGAELRFSMPEQGQSDWKFGRTVQYEILLCEYDSGTFKLTDMINSHKVVGGSPYLKYERVAAGPDIYTPGLTYVSPVEKDQTINIYFELTSGPYKGLRTKTIPVYLRAPAG